jgi:signal transduction histidine kinase
VRLAELVANEHDALVAEFATRARQLVEHEGLSRVELVNSMPYFLDQLVEVLASGQPLADRGSSPASHAGERLQLGFHIDEVVREYFLIGDCILEAATRAGIQPTLSELTVLMRAIGDGASRAAAEYMRRREEELIRREATHAGFLAHELRNWLASARFAFDLLRRREFHNPAELVDVLDSSLRRASQLLDDALLGQRLRGGGVAPARLCARVLVEEVVAELRLHAGEKGVTLEVAAEHDMIVEVDPRLLRSALTNLVRNAIKFTRPRGRVRLRAALVGADVQIEVEDECGGLPPGAIERIFAPFVQGSQDQSGFGLGLPIARAAIEAQGGSLTVHDLSGRGCVFCLTLPRVVAASATLAP